MKHERWEILTVEADVDMVDVEERKLFHTFQEAVDYYMDRLDAGDFEEIQFNDLKHSETLTEVVSVPH